MNEDRLKIEKDTKPMKILFICSLYGPPWNEGGKNIVRVLKKRLTEFSIDAVVRSEKNDNDHKKEHLYFGSKIFAVFKKLFFWYKTARQARSEGVDCLHMLSSVSSILGLKCFVIRILSGIPLILHITGFGKPVFGYSFLLKAERIIVGGSSLKKVFPNSMNIPPVSPHMNFEVERNDSKFSINKEPNKILYLGAMDSVRGVHTLIDALAILKTHLKLKNFRVTLAWNGYGDSNYVGKINSMIKKYRIQDHISWLESVEDVPALYRKHDIVVIPRASKERMLFPLRLLEAISYGKPVVVSDLIETQDIAERCGLVFPHENAKALAKALHRLLTDITLYNKFVQSSYQKTLQYNPMQTVTQIVDLYREVVCGS